jgi:hypothetical protein
MPKSLPPFSYSFSYDGAELQAIVIFCSIQEVLIKLLKPYEGIETCLHTPNFAMHPSRHNLDNNDKLTEKGISNIHLCMIQAYIKSKILTDNLPYLLPKVTSAITLISELESAIEEKLSILREQKRVMKAGLKAGSISEKEYVEVVARIKNLESEHRQSISQTKLEVFESIPELKSVMQVTDEDQFFDYVLKRKDLS